MELTWLDVCVERERERDGRRIKFALGALRHPSGVYKPKILESFRGSNVATSTDL